MATHIYQPELGSDIQQGLGNLGALFAPPTPQALAAQSSIQKNQADTAAQADARTRISNGTASPADYATLGVSDPAVQFGIGDLYRYARTHPDTPITAYDPYQYILRGKAADTFTGQQSAPLNAEQSRILPPALAAAMGVPAMQHGVVGLGDDSKMLPGSGQMPIATAPDTGGDDDNRKWGVVGQDQYGGNVYGYPPALNKDNPAAQVPSTPGAQLPSPSPSAAPAPSISMGTPSAAPTAGSPTLPTLAGVDPSAAPAAAAPTGAPTGAPGGGPGALPTSGTDAFLKTLQPGEASQVQAILAGRAPYPAGFLLAKPFGQRLAQDVTQADPTFDSSNAGARAQTRKEYEAGGANSPAGTITSLNTMIGHLGDLSDASEALGGSNVTAGNGLLNAIRGQYGGTPGATALTQYNNALSAYAQERGKFYSGVGGTESERQLDRAILDPSLPPDQRRAAMQTQVQLFQSKAAELQNRWHTAMGPSNGDFPLLTPQSQGTIDRIGQRAQNVPGLVPQSVGPAPTATSSIVAGPGGTSQNAASNASGPSPQPMGTPGAAQPPAPAATTAAMSPQDLQATIANARSAIARGAPRAAVLQRMQSMGVDPSGTGL